LPRAVNARVSLVKPSARPAASPFHGGLVTANAPPLHLPGEHFAAALGFLALGTLGLAAVAPELANGAFIAPRVVAVVHLFTLGFIATSIFGALYQFLPVAVGAPIRSLRAAHVTFVLLAAGIPTFVVALAVPLPALVPIGGGAVAVAFALFALNFAATLAGATERGITWWALAASCVFLVATLAFGFSLALNVATGFAASIRFDLLAVHVHVALVGWVMLVMVGVGHRLVPMFMLSHGASERPARVAVALLSAGCALLAFSHAGVLRVVAAAIIGAGVVAWFAQIASFHRHRKKRELDGGMRLAMAGVGGVACALVMAPFAIVRGLGSPQVLTTYVFVLVVGGITLFIAGHYFKIVPFLVWFHRYGSRVGKGTVSRVAELYSARAVHVALALFVLGVLTTAVGIASGITPIVRAGAIVLFAAVAIEAREMVRIARRRPA
jgi:hypothetical protein